MFYSKEELTERFKERFGQMEKRDNAAAYSSMASIVQEFVEERRNMTHALYKESNEKQLYYISLEFLLGRMLRSNLSNLGAYEVASDVLREAGFSLEEIEEQEVDPGLGNGGLGRLAACFMDSLASLGLPGHGYAIRYRGGLFTQHIEDGFQKESPVHWITKHDQWDVRHEELAVEVPFYGKLIKHEDGAVEHEDAIWVKAVPYDMPIVGGNSGPVNTLRLWQAEPSGRPLPVGVDKGQYEAATAEISDRLYPDDSYDEGKLLRLKQQYFLCSASLQAIFNEGGFPVKELPEHVAIQINDTHPAMAIPELMRILMDGHGLTWDAAWAITTRTISYTNHTILEEAMEKWDQWLLKELVPRIYDIIEEIDRRFKATLPEGLNEKERHKLAVLDEKQVKMAVLAVVGSYKVNGVASLHTEILKKREMKELYAIFPEKFHNKTNGITHRRWLIQANPELTELITESIGDQWKREPERLAELAHYGADTALLRDFQAVKRLKKNQLIQAVKAAGDNAIDPDSIFDIQIKRFHGYKRQLMNILHVRMLHDRIRNDATFRPHPRTFFFGGKAAPSYHFAKQVIKMIHAVAQQVNSDPVARKYLHVVFIEDYNVSHAEKLIPAAEVSEQISTASKEASGTGNMKFMMNGALTLGTVDGANVEIFEAIGEDNAFVFGLSAEQVMRFEAEGDYRPAEVLEEDAQIRQLIAELEAGELSDGAANAELVIRQLGAEEDPFFVLRDLNSYALAHERMVEAYGDQLAWQGMAWTNVAHSGIFSSDRTIQQYSDDVWNLGRFRLKV